MKRQLCSRCERPLNVCYCHNITPINNTWPVWVLQHHTEKKHAIGTAKIAELSLDNVFIISDKDAHNNKIFQAGISSLSPILVYPGEGAKILDELKAEEVDLKPQRPLLFLDGSWRKTHKMFYDFPDLNKLTRVEINPETRSRYRIRKEPNDTAISTLEAIAYVLEKLENNKEKFQPMLKTMDWMIDKQIEHMGKATYLKNYDNDKHKKGP